MVEEVDLNDEFGNERQISFDEALRKMLFDETVPVHLLFRLSDMTAEEKRLFEEGWQEAADERRREVVRHLADISEFNFSIDFQPLFAESLRDPDSQTRIAALDGLWDSTDVRLVQPIIDVLQQDEVPEVRAAAAGALAHYLLMSAWGQLGGVPEEQITDVLLHTYRHPSTELAVRCVALEALGCINTEEVSALIETAYESQERLLQLSALFAMGNSADERWLPIIMDEMESPYEENRREAARAAGSIGHADAIPLLAELAYDEDRELAVAAIAALGEIGGDQAQSILLEMSEDPELVQLVDTTTAALDESSWSSDEMPFGLWYDEIFDEEE
jgi:HEAT repeat protein